MACWLPPPRSLPGPRVLAALAISNADRRRRPYGPSGSFEGVRRSRFVDRLHQTARNGVRNARPRPSQGRLVQTHEAVGIDYCKRMSGFVAERPGSPFREAESGLWASSSPSPDAHYRAISAVRWQPVPPARQARTGQRPASTGRFGARSAAQSVVVPVPLGDADARRRTARARAAGWGVLPDPTDGLGPGIRRALERRGQPVRALRIADNPALTHRDAGRA